MVKGERDLKKELRRWQERARRWEQQVPDPEALRLAFEPRYRALLASPRRAAAERRHEAFRQVSASYAALTGSPADLDAWDGDEVEVEGITWSVPRDRREPGTFGERLIARGALPLDSICVRGNWRSAP